jgi:YbbR domain-containing protein
MNETIKYIIKNYKPISISLFLAFVLWFVVKTDQIYTTNIEVDLRLKSLAPQMVLLKPIPPKVQVRVQAKGRSLIAMHFYEKQLNLELPDFKKSSVINLESYKNQFNFPAELNIKLIDILYPKKIDIKIDRFQSKKIPVKIAYTIKPLHGYILAGVDVDPDSVLLSGPETIVSSVKYIYGDSVARKDVKYPFDMILKLHEPKKTVTKISPHEAKVHFTVERLVERSFYNIPIQVVGLPAGFIATTTPKNISVRVKGGESRIANLKSIEIAALFNFAAYHEAGRIRYPLQIQLPKNVKLVEASPANFRLNLKRKLK